MDGLHKPAGCFVAVVGPSGAGKDTIMNGARAALKNDARFHFVRRVITRPQMPGNEDHDSLDTEAFEQAAHDGAFTLHWQAHGLSYGLPISLDAEIAQGRVVIANISRRVLEDVRRLYPSCLILVITARPEVLAERLAARGRETREEIDRRLEREVHFNDSHGDVVTIDNSGAAELSISAFIDQLMKLGVR